MTPANLDNKICKSIKKSIDMVINFTKTMKNWTVELAVSGQTQVGVKGHIDIFLEYSFLAQLFVKVMKPLNYIVRKCSKTTIDRIKLFSKSEKEQETQIQKIRINIQDLGMEFGIEKCAIWK